jgi:CTP:molybdopterin cytidylyltransferase MocA
MAPHRKALLPLGGSTFVETVVRTMVGAGLEEVVVVLGHEHERIIDEVRLPEARVEINEEWRQGQLSSLRAAIRALSPGSEGMIFTPVDHPLVELSTYMKLIERWKDSPWSIVIPRCGGRKGHPAIFPSRLYEVLLNEKLPGGARDLIYREFSAVQFVPVSDTGVITDIDTPDDYRRLIGDLP